MAWQWVPNLFAPQNKKKDFTWDARCPYEMCPSNQPYRGAHKPRLKYVQKISPLVFQYQCKDCGCPCNFGIEVPPEDCFDNMDRMNPAIFGKKPDYQFHV